MLEAFIGPTVALISGGFILTNRINNRIAELDKRVDGIEVRIAENYVSKSDFQHALERVENQLVRLEEKLDAIVQIAARRD